MIPIVRRIVGVTLARRIIAPLFTAAMPGVYQTIGTRCTCRWCPPWSPHTEQSVRFAGSLTTSAEPSKAMVSTSVCPCCSHQTRSESVILLLRFMLPCST